jgi:hypothetical protein
MYTVHSGVVLSTLARVEHFDCVVAVVEKALASPAPPSASDWNSGAFEGFLFIFHSPPPALALIVTLIVSVSVSVGVESC